MTSPIVLKHKVYFVKLMRCLINVASGGSFCLALPKASWLHEHPSDEDAVLSPEMASGVQQVLDEFAEEVAA